MYGGFRKFRRVIEHFTKSKNPNSPRYKWDMARRISGHHIKYVTERIDNVDEVIGKSGSLNIKEDELLVYASFDVLMRCKIVDMQAAELLSRDGVVITAPDLEHGGKIRTVVAHYVYYR